MQETITKTQHLYDGRVIKLDLHDVTLPDGATAVRERIIHPGAVALVPLDANGNVLMVRQYRLAANQVMLEIPAGTLKEGEDPAVCAIRELQEETGYTASKLESLGGMFVAPGYTTEFIHLYFATGLTESRLPGDEDEFIEVERVPLKQVLGWVMDGTIIDGKSVSALLKVARKLGV